MYWFKRHFAPNLCKAVYSAVLSQSLVVFFSRHSSRFMLPLLKISLTTNMKVKLPLLWLIESSSLEYNLCNVHLTFN